MPTKIVKNSSRKPPAAGRGRPKGSPNKTTALLKDAIITAATQHGCDGTGQDGLVGYCRYLAKDQPRAFAQLLGRVLPTQLADDQGAPLVVKIVRFSEEFPEAS